MVILKQESTDLGLTVYFEIQELHCYISQLWAYMKVNSTFLY